MLRQVENSVSALCYLHTPFLHIWSFQPFFSYLLATKGLDQRCSWQLVLPSEHPVAPFAHFSEETMLFYSGCSQCLQRFFQTQVVSVKEENSSCYHLDG